MVKALLTAYSKANSFLRATLIPATSDSLAKCTPSNHGKTWWAQGKSFWKTSLRPPTIGQNRYWSLLVEGTGERLDVDEMKQHWLYTGIYCSSCNTSVCGPMCLGWGQCYNRVKPLERSKGYADAVITTVTPRFDVLNWVFRLDMWCLWPKTSSEICSLAPKTCSNPAYGRRQHKI